MSLVPTNPQKYSKPRFSNHEVFCRYSFKAQGKHRLKRGKTWEKLPIRGKNKKRISKDKGDYEKD